MSSVEERVIACYDRKDQSLGRVDLRLDAADFTLLVENKLHSEFGDKQLRRYETARQLLPAGRSGLIAITRNVPSHSELAVSGRGGLGAVRWAHLVADMRGLPITADPIAGQWPLLLDILEAQGDLGVTSVNVDLVRAWAHYLDGREVLADLPVLRRARRPVGGVREGPPKRTTASSVGRQTEQGRLSQRPRHVVSQYPSAAYLECDDVPARLLECVRKDMRAIARSDILLADVVRFRRRRAPRE